MQLLKRIRLDNLNKKYHKISCVLKAIKNRKSEKITRRFSKNTNTFIHRCNAAAKCLGASDERLDTTNFDIHLAYIVNAILKTKRRYRIRHQNQPIFMRTISNPHRRWMSVNAVRNNSVINCLACGIQI